MNRIFKRSMLEYSKLILEKISFDKRLFWKEYRKSFRSLRESESHALRTWVIAKFGFRGKTASKRHGLIKSGKESHDVRV